MSAVGFTKARSMGPVADAVARAGGSVARVFRKAELPLRLIEAPEQFILLRDQLALVEYAARELDDDALPLRLSTQAGVEGLGSFGQYVFAAPTLREAIERCNALISRLLQSATEMRLTIVGRTAIWTYEISDGARIGREKNELLAFGYMCDTLRRYGVAAPDRAALHSRPSARHAIENLMCCDIVRGEEAALAFPSEALDNLSMAKAPRAANCPPDVPLPTDFCAAVEHLTRLALLERRPSLTSVGRRLALSPRSFQRRLEAEGASFEAIRRRVLLARADLLLATRMPITAIAYDLGYSDPAHFSRAFTNWTGESPRSRRRSLCAGLASPAAKP